MSSSKALRDLRKSLHGIKGNSECFGIPLTDSPSKRIEFSTLEDNKNKQGGVESFMNRSLKNAAPNQSNTQ